ncbi:MAG: acetyl-CoA synthase subunit gamma [Spirochaetota bacterium]|nr:MAG: acetyl-CoA synthase subunit gamma [Spirochaetota bacterium]
MKKPECCDKSAKWVEGSIETEAGRIDLVTTSLITADRWGRFKSRVSRFRMKYNVDPGLYAVGNPDDSSPILVSANYKLSFDILRSSIAGLSAYILVLDTKGINVWCAAGKGTFGTEELIRLIKETGLIKLVRHRKIILPQLGAPGIRAHVVQKETGFRVYYGPVYAKDIPDYLKNGYKATEDMRTVHFNFKDRLILTPMEITQVWKSLLIYIAIIFVLFGLQPQGIIFKEAVHGGFHFFLLGLLAIFTGSFLTPLFLPAIPFRAFSLKGFLVGIVTTFIYFYFLRVYTDVFLTIIIFLFFPVVSSFLALEFTGATAYTNISGVKKEVKIAIPFYIVITAISFILFVIYKLNQWGFV